MIMSPFELGLLACMALVGGLCIIHLWTHTITPHGIERWLREFKDELKDVTAEAAAVLKRHPGLRIHRYIMDDLYLAELFVESAERAVRSSHWGRAVKMLSDSDRFLQTIRARLEIAQSATWLKIERNLAKTLEQPAPDAPENPPPRTS